MVRRWHIALSIAALSIGCSASDRDACDDQTNARSCVVIGADAPAEPSEDDDAGLEAARGETHSILVDELLNARDLGGVPAAGGARLAYGALFRGPQLTLSEAGCDEFSALGVRTIVDLRTEPERAASPDAHCAVQRANTVLAPLPVPADLSPQSYLADLDTSDSIAKAFAVLGDEAAYPIYFHCIYGRDRTGVLAAVTLLVLGVAREDVMREYLLSRASVGAYPDSLTAVLDAIERRGGSDAFLKSIGVGARELDTLREHMLIHAR
jgi:protein-tyrosine phosphatase